MWDYDEIVEALKDIIDDKVGDHKAETCQEARGLHDRMQCLETGIMAAFWQKVLARFQANSVSLQASDQNLNSVAAIYDSLQMYIQSLREQFDHVEAHVDNAATKLSMIMMNMSVRNLSRGCN